MVNSGYSPYKWSYKTGRGPFCKSHKFWRNYQASLPDFPRDWFAKIPNSSFVSLWLSTSPWHGRHWLARPAQNIQNTKKFYVAWEPLWKVRWTSPNIPSLKINGRNLKITQLKRKVIFPTFIFGFQPWIFLGVSLPNLRMFLISHPSRSPQTSHVSCWKIRRSWCERGITRKAPFSLSDLHSRVGV